MAGTPPCWRLKSMMRYFRVAAAAMADGDAAVAVAAGLFVQGSQQALFRIHLGQHGVVDDGHAATSGVVGLYSLHCHSDSLS